MTSGQLGVSVDREVEAVGSVRWGLVLGFVAASYGLAWIVALPLWASGGLSNPSFGVLGTLLMFAPAAAVGLIGVVAGRDGLGQLGLGLPRPARRAAVWVLVGLLGAVALALAGVLLSGALGTVRLDLSPLRGPGWLAAAAGIALGVLIIAIPALGEELGWRGWLLPHLEPLGRGRATVLTGVIWGAWHAPVILLGYNYDRPNGLGLVLMIVSAVLIGVILGWMRFRTGSIWPGVAAHAGLNASAGAWTALLVPAGVTVDPTQATVLGWPGWLLIVLLIGVGAGLGRRQRRIVSRDGVDAVVEQSVGTG